MIKEFNGKRPRIAESVFVSESAYVVGDVEIGEGSSVWPGAVIRGDFGAIIIGRDTSVEDNCVLHAASPSSSSKGLAIGDSVVVGHGAVVNCRKIGNQVLIGMNATILHRAEIGGLCIIGAGTLVGQGMVVPDNSFVAGVPGEIMGEPSESQLWWVREGAQDYVKLASQYKKQGL
jgi:carbonic anhydrase/acetyltransferase-like protein (isoleucine patch superfamily)